MDRHREAFREEAFELLTELETALLELEEMPDDAELIGRVFRAMHTIKGSGAMFGFDDISRFTHEVETVFDQVRNGKIAVTKQLIDLTLSARDRVREMLGSSEESSAAASASEEIVSALRSLISDRQQLQAERSIREEESEQSGHEITYRIRFKPSPGLMRNGTNPIMLLNELGTLGRQRVVAQKNSLPRLEELVPEDCCTSWDIILTTDRGMNAIRDVFVFVEDLAEISIQVIDDCGAMTEDGCKKLGAILIERGDIAEAELAAVLPLQKKVGELLVEKGIVAPDQVEAALAEQQHIREVREHREKTEAGSSIRVPSEKLDKLVDLVGELVTIQARLSQMAVGRNDALLFSITEEVERLTAELRDNIMNIRMLPIGSTFSKFRRLVRDLSKELGKEIEMTTSGAETELDKTVIDKLGDPLVHLIRNCIDHGIELPDEREKASKPGSGNIHLSAMHSGAYVVIEIADDGKGLDAEAIRRKGIEKGLITAEAELSEKELYSLILAPGFSTARTVTNVSGRGVGMDVVKRAIDELRGTIEISSRKGQGSTMTLKLPLTLAIIEGLLIRVAGEHFVLPLSAVLECVEFSGTERAAAHGRNIVNVRGQLVPFISLRQKFSLGNTTPAIEHIVIAEISGTQCGFVVDQVIGEHQTVIKSLGSIYRSVAGISGATILGDGTVALILDMPALFQMAAAEEISS
ncbi:MAG: chemotaxis protein CheA [Nitrospirae bacterium]|nr:chemotaxis protein CheA [Nitrospirota bacterium]